MVKARVIIEGNVQGVGFRVWVKLFARRFGVDGLVRNLVDSSVELFVDGPRGSIKAFLERISVKGVFEDPLSLHVENVEVFWEGERKYEPAWREYKGFEIDYGVDELEAVDKETLESLEWSKLHFAGMSRVFREESGGLKGEFGELRKEFRESFGGLREESREGFDGLKNEFGELRKESREGFDGLKNEFKAVGSGICDLRDGLESVASGIRGMGEDQKAMYLEIKGMRGDVSSSFEEMAKRYDAISLELIRTREELTKAVDILIVLVRKFVKE